jgi:formyltetrahydrofolate deformylase
MSWSLHFTDVIPQIAIFVSRKLHCLYDLLLKHKSGYLRCRIPFIVSNHPHAEDVARFFGIKFIKFPITKTNKAQQEKKQLELLKKHNIELIVLARYMQVLSEDFVNQYPNRIINIHHSFLPAFAGKNPYQQAYKRGVKIIGATSHYVTKILDSGPIIEQEITKVGHQDSVEDLKRKGTDLERVVLGRSVRAYLERKILAYNNKTVVFG